MTTKKDMSKEMIGEDSFSCRLFGKRNRHTVYTSFILFFIYLMCYLFFSFLQGNVVGRDASRYIALADSAQNTWFLKKPEEEKLHPPLLLMLMIHGNHLLGISTSKSGLAINLFCGAMCSVLVFTGCWTLFKSYYLALISSVLYFLTPGIKEVSIDILRDAPSLCLNLLALNFYILFLDRKKKTYLCLCGCATALSVGFRLENFEFLVIFSILLIYSSILYYNKKIDYVKSIGMGFVSLGIGFLIGSFIVYMICLRSDYYTKMIIPRVYHYYSSMFQ